MGLMRCTTYMPFNSDQVVAKKARDKARKKFKRITLFLMQLALDILLTVCFPNIY